MTLLRPLRDGPVIAIAVAFAVSRVAAYAAGVRFDVTPLDDFWQFVEPDLLRTRLLESLYYLHSQPPLFNLALGVGLKVFGSEFGLAAHVVYVVLGVTWTFALFVLLVQVGVPRWGAAGVTIFLTISPSMLVHESWLFYEYPTMTLLVLAALALFEYGRRRTTAAGLAFFGLAAAVVLTRSMFQAVWILAVLALVLAASHGSRSAVLKAAVLPLLLVALLYGKNVSVFGILTTSSWLGMNLAQATIYYSETTQEERRRLVADGTLSRVSLVAPFAPLSAYRGLVDVPPPTGVAVLDRETKPGGRPNLNHKAYIDVSRMYFHDVRAYLRRDPSVLWPAVLASLRVYVIPSTEYPWVARNAAAVDRWSRVYAVLLARQQGGARMAFTIAAAYALALVYGLLLLARVIARRRDPDAAVTVLAFAALTVAYVTFAQLLTEAGENNRMRVLVDPLATLLAAAAVTEVARALRRRLVGGGRRSMSGAAG